MNCIKCGTTIPIKAVFCPKCGSPQKEKRCPQCDTLIVSGDSFCSCCGHPVHTNGRSGLPVSKKKKKKRTCCLFFLIVGIMLLIVLIIFPITNYLYEQYVNDSKIRTAMVQIQLLDDAVQQYELDVGTYPSDLQGLMENIDQSEKWDGPYIKPSVPLDPWGSEYQYLVPGEYDDFDLYSLGADECYGGVGVNADFGIYSGVVFGTLLGWRERLIAESDGEQIIVKGRDFYNCTVQLPDQELFVSMAILEATGPQYDKLRHVGFSSEQILNYVMREKYLPLVRYATGKLNINGDVQLTKENWKTIKSEMMLRQMRGVFINLKNDDKNTKYSSVQYNSSNYKKAFQEALSKTWDARKSAVKKDEDPNKVKVEYPDLIKENKAVLDAVIKASRNIW